MMHLILAFLIAGFPGVLVCLLCGGGGHRHHHYDCDC